MLNPLHKDLLLASSQIIFELELAEKYSKNNKNHLTPHQKYLFFLGLKNWGLALVRIDRICTKRPPEQTIAILSMAFALINSQRYSNFTIVNQAVEATKKIPGKKLASLINLILRKSLRKDKFSLDDESNLVAKWNAPFWWIKKIKRELGINAESFFLSNKQHPPLTLRVAHSHKKIEQIKYQLQRKETKIFELGPNSLGVVPPYDVRSSIPFKCGEVSIQDLSSQKIADLIKPRKGAFILDACAAPGGKTFALASKYPLLNIISSDISPQRLKKMKTDMERQNKFLLSKPKVLVADICEKKSKEKISSMSKKGFDFVILDAPCSGSGVVRRHPEIPWNRSQEQITKLVRLQSDMLKSAWEFLKTDGILVYSVCSIFREEGEKQIINFLDLNCDAIKIKTCLLLPNFLENEVCSNEEKNYLGFDGFFYGLLKKSNSSKNGSI